MPNTKIGHRPHTRRPYKSRNRYDELTTKDCLNYDCPYGYKFQTFIMDQRYCDRCLEDKKSEEKTNMNKWAMLKAEAKDKRTKKNISKISKAEAKQKQRILKAETINKWNMFIAEISKKDVPT